MVDDDFDPDDIETFNDDADDEYVRIRKSDLKKVRTAARSAGAAKKDLAAYRRQETVRTAGIDGLNDRQIAVIAAQAEGDETPENLKRIAQDLGWYTPPPPSEEEQQVDGEVDAHNEAANATSGGQPAAAVSTLTPADVAEWGVDKQMRFLQTHPHLYELVKRGEAVSLPGGFN